MCSRDGAPLGVSVGDPRRKGSECRNEVDMSNSYTLEQLVENPEALGKVVEAVFTPLEAKLSNGNEDILTAFSVTVGNMLKFAAPWEVFNDKAFKDIPVDSQRQLAKYAKRHAAYSTEVANCHVVYMTENDVRGIASVLDSVNAPTPLVRMNEYHFDDKGRIVKGQEYEVPAFRGQFVELLYTKVHANVQRFAYDFQQARAGAKSPLAEFVKGGEMAILSLNTDNKVTLQNGKTIPGYSVTPVDYAQVTGRAANILGIGPKSRSVIVRP